jgi:hypothetical protein
MGFACVISDCEFFLLYLYLPQMGPPRPEALILTPYSALFIEMQ